MDINNLSPELKEKVEKCETPEDLLALAKAEGYELSDDELDGISGGVVWNCSNHKCSLHRCSTYRE